eukprot:gb/GECH01010790.1/.p1 GENE.gb/GECH01010790.1/~~gb/GECH01010790.1/.p1  ORF type:complete len:253 (+),score=39.50 gb/GECH01010790.1/:1-759(+)
MMRSVSLSCIVLFALSLTLVRGQSDSTPGNMLTLGVHLTQNQCPQTQILTLGLNQPLWSSVTCEFRCGGSSLDPEIYSCDSSASSCSNCTNTGNFHDHTDCVPFEGSYAQFKCLEDTPTDPYTAGMKFVRLHSDSSCQNQVATASIQDGFCPTVSGQFTFDVDCSAGEDKPKLKKDCPSNCEDCGSTIDMTDNDCVKVSFNNRELYATAYCKSDESSSSMSESESGASSNVFSVSFAISIILIVVSISLIIV